MVMIFLKLKQTVYQKIIFCLFLAWELEVNEALKVWIFDLK